jgi:integrase
MKKFTVQLTATELKSLEKLRKKTKELTLDQLFEKAFKEYWSASRFEASGWKKEVELLYRKNISPTFGGIKLSLIEPLSVKKWHRTFEGKNTTGNRSLAVLTRLFTYAAEEELFPQNSNPCSLVSKFKERKRKRFASEDEIQKIADILKRESESKPADVAFIYLLMFTGSRPRAIERATRNQLERVEVMGKTFGVLTFQGKSSETTGDDEVVVIPPFAMGVLDRLPLNLKTLTGTKMPRTLWDKIKKEAGCPDLWARDWRRTFATLALSGGLSSGILGEILNHRSAQTTKIYSKLLSRERLNAVSKVSDRIAEIMETKR